MSVLSAADQKRKNLIHRLSILVLALTAIYIFLDWLLGIHVQPFVYGLFFLNAFFSYFLNRSNRLSLSKWFGLLFFNTIIFLVSSSEPFETGIHLHFVAAGAVALALFGYEEYKSALFFCRTFHYFIPDCFFDRYLFHQLPLVYTEAVTDFFCHQHLGIGHRIHLLIHVIFES